MRDEELHGAPWYLNLKLAEVVLRAILPRWKGGIHIGGRIWFDVVRINNLFLCVGFEWWSEEKQAERVVELGFPQGRTGRQSTRGLGRKEGKERSKVESRSEVDNVVVVVAAGVKSAGLRQ